MHMNHGDDGPGWLRITGAHYAFHDMNDAAGPQTTVKLSLHDIETMALMWESGIEQKEIGEMYGISRQSVSKYIRRHTGEERQWRYEQPDYTPRSAHCYIRAKI